MLLSACGDADGTGAARAPTRTGDVVDAGRSGRPPRDAGGTGAADDAGEDDVAPWRDASAELADAGPGVHVLLGDEAPQEANEVFLLQLSPLGLQADFASGAQLTVSFQAAVGDYGCHDGARLQYQDARGSWYADSRRGDCRVQVTSFETAQGAPVAGHFEGELERVGGEDADALRIAGRFEVGHP